MSKREDGEDTDGVVPAIIEVLQIVKALTSAVFMAGFCYMLYILFG